MPFIEAPTTFYLGREYDPQANRLSEDVVYYDSRDLTTHAVVVGMTGSGKTGLCISMLEEAILDNIPSIVIDPKGDITNLLLTFPELQAEQFRPWVNVDDARRAGLSVPEYAADVAQRWKDGLQSWGIVPDRLRWLQRAAKYSIYTPGSDAGLPISILASLAAPREGWAGNEEALREKINGITTALLALIGKNVEPVKDKEHVLVANIFENAWRQGIDLTLEDIILQVQKPPFNKLGVFPIDKYMSEKARYKLAMELNNIIAAPSFQSWLQGQSMDISRLLYQPNGRPKVSVFYIAHLSDAERMFMITLILENMLGWMRTLSGTTSLRALLYIDEMFGYFPPYPRNPPTKEPILRLLKQARAFGIGLILATQNPGDLDYKGLTNAGTWFIGRLTSDNDKQKVISGLKSMASADENMNLAEVEQLIADLTPRVFFMRNVHDTEGPILFHTRWVMNYLRGPLTRQQVQTLMGSQRRELLAQVATSYAQQNGGNQGWTQPQTPGVPPPPPTIPGAPPRTSPGGGQFGSQSAPPRPNSMPMPPMPDQPTVPPSQVNFNNPNDSQRTTQGGQAPRGYSDNRPPLSSSTAEYFLPTQRTTQQAIGEWEQQTRMRAQAFGGATLVYEPVLLAQAAVRFQEKKAQIYVARYFAYHVPNVQRSGIVHWEQYQAPPVDSRTISSEPFDQAYYGDLPPGLTDSSRMKALEREIVDMLYNTSRLTIPFNPELKIYGDPDQDSSEYQAAVQQAAREKRDVEMDKTSQKFAGMMEKLEDKMRRKELELSAEQKELRDRKREEMFTTGEALLSLWKGRTNYTLSRMSRATRYRRQTNEDLAESRIVLDEIEREMAEVEQDFERALQQINEKWAKIAALETDHIISPYKKDIHLELFGVGWVPYWHANINNQTVIMPAFNG